MGDWGFDSFENDNACDWIDDLCDKPDANQIFAALSAVADAGSGEFLESSICSEAIAAAELIAAGRGDANINISKEAKDCVRKLKLKPDSDSISLALRAVERIRTDSELKELFDESKDSAKWYASVSNLESRLRQ